MARLFTEEWLAERKRKAREWNGNTISDAYARGTDEIANVEPVKLVRTASGKPVTTLYPLVNLCRQARIAEPVPEHRFHPTRKWRFDYAFPIAMLAVEIEGG